MKTISFLMSSMVFLTALLLTACSNSGGSSAPPPPVALTGLTATPKDGYVIISGVPASGVTGMNLYWSTASGVSPSNGIKIIVGTGDVQAHTGAINNTTYYYVATTISGGVESQASVQVSATPVAVATGLTDPLYVDQWHLQSIGSTSGATTTAAAGEDLNVEPAWASVKGIGVRVAVVDDGLEIAHEDLASNVDTNDLSYNYVTSSNDPTYSPADTTGGHGTSVAGIIAARDLNGLGGRGVAPRAKLVGYNMLQNATDSNIADALTRGAAGIFVSNNSWGPPGRTGGLSLATTSWRSAIDTGLASGRGSKGTVYVASAGNGGPTDNANYHGIKNAHGIIAVAAVNDQGKQSSYSESGANLWVSSPGGEFCDSHTITTTDRSGNVGGENPPAAGYTDYADTKYTRCMNGTSSAAPGISGVVALMLEANPSLGWRDVRLILAQSARKNDLADTGWFTTVGGKYHFNHKYGFGVADANAAVNLAKNNWTNVGVETTQTSFTASPNMLIPDNTGASVSSTISVTTGAVTSIEFMEITFSAADHTYMGDLEVTLTNQQTGTISRLAETHGCYDANGNLLPSPCPTAYNNWVFGSSAHLGESPAGDWKLTVTDRGPGDTGHFQSWGMKFYGR